MHEDVLKHMNDMAARFAAMGINLELPPSSSKAMGTVYTEMNLGKSLAARFAFNPLHTNPLKMFQGGFLCAAFDEVFGPLTYMAAGQPVVTLEMSTTFLRPFVAKDEFIEIRAEVVAKTKSILLLKAEAKNKDGKLIATGSNHSMILSDAQISRA